MEVIVCIKQVLNTFLETINDNKIVERDKYELINNPNDLYAVEEGLRIKEFFGGTVTCISMAPQNCQNNLKELLSLGVDSVILLSDKEFAGSDTLATSYILSTAIKKISKYDLILLGTQSLDGETGQVGPGIAEQLNISHVTNVSKIQVNDTNCCKTIVVEKDFEEKKVCLQLTIPALLCVKNHMNEVRIPSVINRLKAATTHIQVWTRNDIDIDLKRVGLAGSPTQVINLYEHSITVTNHENTEIFLYEKDRTCISYISSKIRRYRE